MKNVLLIFLLTPYFLTAGSGDGSVTKKERKFATSNLKVTKKNISSLVSDLNTDQWYYKPNDSTWSISEICEHVVIVEKSLYSLITEKVLKSEKKPKLDPETLVTDKDLIASIKDRSESNKVKTGAQFEPKIGISSPSQFISEFNELRNRTIDFTSTTQAELKSYYQRNPLGNLSAYQWFLVMGTHSERHMNQIKELMNNDAFPQ